MHKAFILSASALALMASAAFAQTTSTTGNQSPSAASATNAPAANTASTMGSTNRGVPDISRASRIVGQDIYNNNNEDIGEISELILDPNTGQVKQVIVSVGGFLGIGDRQVALNWSDLKLMNRSEMGGANRTTGTATTGTNAAGPAVSTNTTATTGTANRNQDMRFTVNMTRDQLKNAPEFKYDQR